MNTVQPIDLQPEVLSLLREAGLPVADLDSTNKVQWLGFREAGTLVGVVGIEPRGPTALLRSLAVASTHRRRGLGTTLVATAESLAVAHGIRSLYLLTMTAESFFLRLGYMVRPRSEAPDAIAATAQFKGLCPSSSILLGKALAQKTGVRE